MTMKHTCDLAEGRVLQIGEPRAIFALWIRVARDKEIPQSLRFCRSFQLFDKWMDCPSEHHHQIIREEISIWSTHRLSDIVWLYNTVSLG